MIGIYEDDFLDYLKKNLGDNIKITSKNFITPCPWCEYNEEKSHYHLYISLEAPIFHCFHASCEQRGTLRKLLKKIEGHDISDSFIDKEKLEEFSKKSSTFTLPDYRPDIKLPKIRMGQYPNKEIYLKKRLKFSNMSLYNIKGLIFDVISFLDMNNIPIDERLFRMKDYLHSNFIGFLTEQKSTVVFRNIDDSQSFRYYKLQISSNAFLDYYKLLGNNHASNHIVLAEGIFDIFSEHIYDILNLKDNVNMYASVFSSSFSSLLYSVAFYEKIFRPKVTILSDMGISLSNYKKLKYFNKHLIDSLEVYYNVYGKDFNDTPVLPRKFVI